MPAARDSQWYKPCPEWPRKHFFLFDQSENQTQGRQLQRWCTLNWKIFQSIDTGYSNSAFLIMIIFNQIDWYKQFNSTLRSPSCVVVSWCSEVSKALSEFGSPPPHHHPPYWINVFATGTWRYIFFSLKIYILYLDELGKGYSILIMRKIYYVTCLWYLLTLVEWYVHVI